MCKKECVTSDHKPVILDNLKCILYEQEEAFFEMVEPLDEDGENKEV